MTIHPAVPKKIELRLFRSKALIMFCSPVHKCPLFAVNEQLIHPAVPIKIALCLFRLKTVCSYNVLFSCSQIADCRQTLLLNPFPVNVPKKIELLLLFKPKKTLLLYSTAE